MGSISLGNREFHVENGRLSIVAEEHLLRITCDPEQTLSLLALLNAHRDEIVHSVAELKAAQQQQSSLQERVNRLFE